MTTYINDYFVQLMHGKCCTLNLQYEKIFQTQTKLAKKLIGKTRIRLTE